MKKESNEHVRLPTGLVLPVIRLDYPLTKKRSIRGADFLMFINVIAGPSPTSLQKQLTGISVTLEEEMHSQSGQAIQPGEYALMVWHAQTKGNLIIMYNYDEDKARPTIKLTSDLYAATSDQLREAITVIRSMGLPTPKTRSRSRFTEAEKQAIVSEWKDTQKTQKQVANDYGITPRIIRKWAKELQAQEKRS